MGKYENLAKEIVMNVGGGDFLKLSKLFILIGAVMFLVVGCNQVENGNVDPDEPITLYFTRHGRTMLNTMDISQGWIDSPLTPEGIEVAEKLGSGLEKSGIHFDQVYSSDSGRAYETAELILNNNGQNDLLITRDKRLREANFGSFEAKPNMEMLQAVADQKGVTLEEFLGGSFADGVNEVQNFLYEMDQNKDASEMGWPAESADMVKERLLEAIDDIIEVAMEDGSRHILIVSHGNSIIKTLSALDPDADITLIDNASVSQVTYQDGEFTIQSINDLSYIELGN